MEKRYRVTLTDEERAELSAMVSSGKSNARKLVRAGILLLADQAEGSSAKSDPEIVDALGCGRAGDRGASSTAIRRRGTGGNSGANSIKTHLGERQK